MAIAWYAKASSMEAFVSVSVSSYPLVVLTQDELKAA
ncbi:hypothetical protein CCACVL1_18080 [Corchorus capsularis]|uniref:Uncharacterized protein n=1 Tax=Corchorus capsularis TaxID=210143 RepID=A0A1R3HN67_COCAP|nr:hypothetical protein CCACVL1_18080 [Corchorus capsularis]